METVNNPDRNLRSRFAVAGKRCRSLMPDRAIRIFLILISPETSRLLPAASFERTALPAARERSRGVLCRYLHSSHALLPQRLRHRRAARRIAINLRCRDAPPPNALFPV